MPSYIIKRIGPGGKVTYLDRHTGQWLDHPNSPDSRYKTKSGATRALNHYRNKICGTQEGWEGIRPDDIYFVSADNEIKFWEEMTQELRHKEHKRIREEKRCPICTCRSSLGHFVDCKLYRLQRSPTEFLDTKIAETQERIKTFKALMEECNTNIKVCNAEVEQLKALKTVIIKTCET